MSSVATQPLAEPPPRIACRGLRKYREVSLPSRGQSCKHTLNAAENRLSRYGIQLPFWQSPHSGCCLPRDVCAVVNEVNVEKFLSTPAATPRMRQPKHAGRPVHFAARAYIALRVCCGFESTVGLLSLKQALSAALGARNHESVLPRSLSSSMVSSGMPFLFCLSVLERPNKPVSGLPFSSHR